MHRLSNGLANTRLAKVLIWGAASAVGVAVFAAVAGSQVLPPGTDSDCAGQVPIVVGSDEAAQSDLYSAATLAGVIETTCIVLAGPRDGEMDAAQIARLDAALADASAGTSIGGWVIGGEAAVPEAKIAGRNLKRLNGVDRWHTARLAGAIAADPDGDVAALTEATAPAEGELGGGSVIVDGVEVRLPPGLDAPCEGQVPIVVAVDAAAQADLYSAATLAGVLNTTCYVLAGPRGEPMSDEQRARLEAAEGEGWVVGGEAAVPADKVADFDLTRQGGEDRWETARFIGETAVEQAAAPSSTTTTTERIVRRVSTGGGGGSSRSGGGGSSVRRPPTVVPPVTVPTGTTSTTSTTEPEPTTTTSSTVPDDTTTTTTEPEPTTTTTEPPQAASMFAPTITVEVPQLDRTTGTNIWADQTFAVAIARAGASATNSDCSADVTVTFTVQTDGSVPDDGSAPVTLAGTTGAGATCEYTVTFPGALSDSTDTDFAWTMTAPTVTEVTISEASRTATGTYTVSEITFDPDPTITVPAGNDGATFDVTFASTHANCSGNPSAVTLTYTVPTGGTTAQPGITDNSSLIAYPVGATAVADLCAYTVTFPTNENGAALALELQTTSPAPSTTVSGTSQAISATYEQREPMGATDDGTVSAGQSHACALATDGSVNCWGDNAFGQLDAPDEMFASVSAGERHTCGVLAAAGAGGEPGRSTGGSVVCWGSNGPAGVPDNRATPPAGAFSQVSAGGQHTCGVRAAAGPAGEAAGTVACWGADGAVVTLGRPLSNSFEHRTQGTVRTDGRVSEAPTGTFASVSAGQWHSCGIRSGGATSGTIACWGDDTFGQSTPPSGRFLAVSAGFAHTCAVKVDDTVECWGDGTPTDAQNVDDQAGTFEAPAGSFSLVSVGASHACGVRAAVGPGGEPGGPTGGTVTCWGGDDLGQSTAPAGSFAEVSAGAVASCGVRAAVGPAGEAVGTVACWGYGDEGQATAPTGSFEPVSAGGAHTCGVKADATVECWGDNTDGQTTVPASTTFTHVSAGLRHTCGVVSGGANDGTVTCWGSNGPTGAEDGRRDDAPTGTFSKVSAGERHSCGVKADMTIACWGFDGAVVTPPAQPGGQPTVTTDGRVSMVPAGEFSDVSAGGEHTCALATHGSLACWGSNGRASSGVVCTGTPVGDPRGVVSCVDANGDPVDLNIEIAALPGDPGQGRVSDMPTGAFSAVSAGHAHTCAVRSDDTPGSATDGTVECWGSDLFGQATPPTGAFSAVAAGPRHTCGVRAGGASNGIVECWGDNTFGQTNALTEVFVTVTVGERHSCATRADGTVACWGVGDFASRAEASQPMGSFTPTITVDVPPLVGTTPSENIWAGETLVVTIARASGADGGCSLHTERSVTFTVQPDGSVTPDAQMPTSLIATANSGATCSYTVTFPAGPTAVDGGDFDFAMTPAAPTTATLSDASATDRSAAVDYTVGAVTFAPDADITLPSRSHGKRFAVGFTGSGTDCPDGSLTYAVQADGTTVEIAADSELLVAYPADATAATAVCSYTAAFTPTEVDATRLALTPDPTDDTDATGTDQAIAATYALATPPTMGSTADAPSPYAPTFTQVSVGGRFACARMSDGAVSCWGRNAFGAIDELPAESFKQVAAGDEHVCALKADDTLACWGANAGGGGNVPSAQAAVAFEQVVAGDVHTCARKADGSVVCWGWNGYSGALLAVPASTTFSSISASFDHTCGIRSGGANAGTVVCWGDSSDGRTTVPPAEATTTFSSVSAGERHTCGVRSGGATAGSIVCWGRNGDNQATVPAAEASSTFTQVSAGYAHTCALKDDGTVACWGSNLFGEATAPAGTFTAVDAGQERSCGVRADGSVTCWGYGDVSRAMPPSGAFSQLSAGSEHTCGVRAAAGPGGEAVGTVTCWGSNGPAHSLDNRATPPMGTFSQVAAGTEHTCGIRAAVGPGGEAVGTVTCWGDNTSNQATVKAGEEASTFTSISAGNLHTCALKDDNSVVCWGNDGQGRSTVPNIQSNRSFASISAGFSHTCGVLDNDNVLCWGQDSSNQVTLPSGEQATSFNVVSAGNGFTCALRDNDTLVCWGNSGDGKTAPPTGVFSALAAGRDHACALRTNGTVACWGSNLYGETDAPAGVFTALTSGNGYSCGTRVDGTAVCWGAGTAQRSVRAPLTAVSSGDTFSCALRSNGTVFCWGDNADSQLTVPTGTFTQIDVGANHACGVRAAAGPGGEAAGTVACWGDSADAKTTAPAPGTNLTFTAVVAAGRHSCGLKSDGTVACWGNSSDARTTVPQLEDGEQYTQLSAGWDHTCAVKEDGTAACWGLNDNRQATVPSLPEGVTYASISAGRLHSCAVRSDGTVVCWGLDGDGLNTDGRVTRVPNATFVSVAAGADHTCGLKTDQRVACWGRVFERQTRAPSDNFLSVTSGGEHTCGLKLDGSVRCWGYMNFGQSMSPVGTFDTVSGGRWHSCAVETDGSAQCWGNNDHSRATPPALAAGESYTQMSAGRSHSCGLKAGGAAACWGSDGDRIDGRVSNTPTAALTSVAAGGYNSCGVIESDGRATCWGTSLGQSPVPAPGAGQRFTHVSAGLEHACGLKDSGAVDCWGYDPPFGNGRVRHTPMTATDLFSDVSVGDEHSCAVRQTSGAIVCWGGNGVGQSTEPTGEFSAVAAGGYHTCAIRSGGANAGTVVCWGDSSAGQLDAPEGTFDAITAGARHSCAVRSGGDADNAVVCWGAGIDWPLVTGRSPSS